MGASYVVRAENPAMESENRIHSDDVARRFGFRGGLVPGVVIYRYACPAIVVALGQDWPARGVAEARFSKPVYDGDQIRVSTELEPDGAAVVSIENEAGDLCARVRAEVPAVTVAPPPADGYASTPAPTDRPPATVETVVRGAALGSVGGLVGPEEAHPALLLWLANRFLTANYEISPWIHAGSRVRHYRELAAGDTIEARGRVAAAFERGGHRFMELDILVLAGGRPAAQIDHTAIYQLASEAAQA